jgi:hypothetical protein
MGLAIAESVVNTFRLASISLIVMLVNCIKDVSPRCTVAGLRQAMHHLLNAVSHSSFYLLLLSPVDHQVIMDLFKQLSGDGFDFCPLYSLIVRFPDTADQKWRVPLCSALLEHPAAPLHRVRQ